MNKSSFCSVGGGLTTGTEERVEKCESTISLAPAGKTCEAQMVIETSNKGEANMQMSKTALETLVRAYLAEFPQSEVPLLALAAKLAEGYEWTEEGALFHPEGAMPEPEEMPEASDTVDAGELIEAGVRFTITEEDRVFIKDSLSWMDEGVPVFADLSGELVGVKERAGRNRSDLLEVLTEEEACEFIGQALDDGEAMVQDIGQVANRNLMLSQLLGIAVEVATQKAEAVAEERDRMTRPVVIGTEVVAVEWKFGDMPQLPFDGDLYARARITVQRDALGGTWAHDGAYNIGDRPGLVQSEAWQNDERFTKQEQFWQPGDREGNELDFSEALDAAAEEDCFNELYDRSTKAADGQPGVRKSSEYKRYLMDQEQLRWKRTHRVVERIFALSYGDAVALVEKCRAAYQANVKECAPGLGRERTASGWKATPLKGKSAIEWLRQRGAASLKGKKPSPTFQVDKGEAWHKLLFNKKQLGAIEQALAYRQHRHEVLGK